MQGPNIEKLVIQFFHAMQVGQGTRHQKSMCGFYINVQDGHLRNKFYIKFISVPLPFVTV
ncbi:hypothetical protein CD113_05310 [Staphylococcus simiae]|nr:hypothetical protein CD113_05310 [Staphylococcus simiae]